MTASGGERLARVALSRLVEPGTPTVAQAVEEHGADPVWRALRAGRAVGRVSARLAAAVAARATVADPHADLASARRVGRVLVPGDDEWPGDRLDWPVDALEWAPPLCLYVRGGPRLDQAVARSVAVVGARAATAYGASMATELAAGLAEQGCAVVSGAAFGIDAAAHRGALGAAGAPTVAVLACGVDVAYPRAHDRLLDRVAAQGLVVSEVPPGTGPTRSRFLVRNRLIAGLSAGTVVVEAALRSGSLSTAARAEELSRPVMAVPGPVTSSASAGCHARLRLGAVCVTSAAEVLETVGGLGLDACSPDQAPERPRDLLPDAARRVLDALPSRDPTGEAVLARESGLPLREVQQTLPPLLLAGYVDRTAEGYRLTALGAGRSSRRGPGRAGASA